MANTCTCASAITISAVANLIKPALNVLMNPADTEAISAGISIATGSGAEQANQSFLKEYTPAQFGVTTIDLFGSITNAFGDTISLLKIKALVIANKSLTHSLVIGGAASPIMSGTNTITLPPATTQGPSMLALVGNGLGWTVTNTSADALVLTDGGEDTNAGQFDVLVIGTQTA